MQLPGQMFHSGSDSPSGTANLNEHIDNIRQDKRKHETLLPDIHALETNKRKKGKLFMCLSNFSVCSTFYKTKIPQLFMQNLT